MRPAGVPGEPAPGAAGGHPRPGSVFTCTWRDGAGPQYSRKASDTLAQPEAFKRCIDDQLALGTFTSTSTMTFAAYATGWVETWSLKDLTRERYRGILSRQPLPEGPIDDACRPGHPRQVNETNRPPAGGWVVDQRRDGRAVRVSAHVDAGFLVLSTWKSDTCVSTVRLLPDEAARLVSSITDGLARLATSSEREHDHGQRLADVEARLAHLEWPNRA